MSHSPPPQPSGLEPARRTSLIAYSIAAIVWLALLAPLAWWGLPSKANDDLLFGGEKAWSAERFAAAAALEQRSERVGGADTDLNPLGPITAPTELTSSDAKRAEILRRYRLFSRQPDEMITFMALQRMKPRQLDFDPRQYQYGGAYIYLVGAAAGACSLFDLTTITSDIGLYLQNPEAFARFYLVSRFISLLFAAGLLVAAARLAERLSGRLAGWAALLLLATSPVLLSGALEAKPHVPSACLLAWAMLASLRCVESARWRDVLPLGALAGLSFGFVLTGLAAALLWPGLLWRWRTDRSALTRLLAAGGIALAAYLATNPYVPYNLLMNRAALQSNLGNSTAMYSVARLSEGAARVGVLMVEACGAGVCALGLAGFSFLIFRDRGPLLRVAALPAVGMFALCVLIGAGKPAEFARFLLLPTLWLCIGAGTMIGGPATRFAYALRGTGTATPHIVRVWRGLRAVVGLTICIVLASGPAYLASFQRDAGEKNESRRLAGEFLAKSAAPADAIAVIQEPAPYSIPPLDFTHRRIVLLPPREPTPLDGRALPPWLVLTADDDDAVANLWWRREYELVRRVPPPDVPLSPITWADKPTYVFHRIEGTSP